MAVKMQMTNEEIVKSYKEAKHKGQQIGILADLNVCPKELIIDILVEGGIPRTAFSRYKGQNLVKAIKSEVKVHEKKKRAEEETAIVKEAVTALKDRLTREYNEMKGEWEHIEAEYKYKILVVERILGGSDDT